MNILLLFLNIIAILICAISIYSRDFFYGICCILQTPFSLAGYLYDKCPFSKRREMILNRLFKNAAGIKSYSCFPKIPQSWSYIHKIIQRGLF